MTAPGADDDSDPDSDDDGAAPGVPGLEPPSLRSVPPLTATTAAGPEPVGPFTVVSPLGVHEQVDDGPEPPTER
jgi:hypothetical protein